MEGLIEASGKHWLRGSQRHRGKSPEGGLDKSVEKALQHMGRDLGDVLGSFPGPGSLASYPGLQVWETVRCSHAPHMETQRVGALWSRPMGVRATPRCSPLLPGEEVPVASYEGSSKGPGRCNPRWVTRSEHGLGWNFHSFLPTFHSPQSCPW